MSSDTKHLKSVSGKPCRFELQEGDAVLIPDHQGFNEHLHFILFSFDGTDERMFVTANLTDRDSGIDNTVVLRPGDHPFIRKLSVIFYKKSQIWKEVDLKKVFVWSGRQDSLRRHVLKRVQKGFFDSLHTPRNLKTICRAEYLEEQLDL